VLKERKLYEGLIIENFITNEIEFINEANEVVYDIWFIRLGNLAKVVGSTHEVLGLTSNKYYDILHENGADCRYINGWRYCFYSNEERVKKSIKALAPYLIMAKLTE